MTAPRLRFPAQRPGRVRLVLAHRRGPKSALCRSPRRSFNLRVAAPCLYFSDRIWTRFGRRLPFILVSFAVLAAVLPQVLAVEHGQWLQRRSFLVRLDGARSTSGLRQQEQAESHAPMESTYGGREHELPTGATDEFGKILDGALRKGGKVMIPAFAVERTQQLLYILNQLFHSGKLRQVPVYVDSPLAVNATEIFRIHPECFNETVYRFLFDERGTFVCLS